MASSSKVASSRDGMLLKLDRMKSAFSTEQNSILAQQEALRKATLLKHRKVSTQLKLDMVHRQLSDLRRSVHDESDTAHRQFYRHQMEELSSELQDLGVTLERVERNAFYVRRRMLSNSSSNLDVGDVPLSSSHPAIFCPQGEDDVVTAPGTGMERKFRSSVGGFKSRAMRLMSTPPKLRKKFLFGELRAVASLSSLNVKSTSQSTLDDDPSQKNSKTRKGPLRFLGSLVDNQIRRRFWNSTKRTKSAGNVLDENKTGSSDDVSKDCNGFRTVKPDVVVHYMSSSSSSSSSEDSDDEEWKRDAKCQAEMPSEQAPNLDAQVDPSVLAEIEDFEKMAAQYISQHSQRTIS